MGWDPSGCFAISIFVIGLLVCGLVGGALGGYTAATNGQDIFTGILTGALLGAAVGGIISIGGVVLSGAISSVISKSVSDLVSFAFYGESFGSWEDYALAFVFGGFTGSLGNAIKAGKNLSKAAKIGLNVAKFTTDVAARPLANQLVKIGTRGSDFNGNKLMYDIITRSISYEGSKKNNAVKCIWLRHKSRFRKSILKRKL